VFIDVMLTPFKCSVSISKSIYNSLNALVFVVCCFILGSTHDHCMGGFCL
jgi:hypothetical protein